jgi:uncharacterized peroxidase-related enzyme
MTRLKALDPELASGKTKEMFEIIQTKYGMVSNMMRTMGNSPAFLEGSLCMADSLAEGTLGAKTGELIALAVAESNSCDYCLSAHTYIGMQLLKLDAGTIEAARLGNASDKRMDAILKFSKALVGKRGMVDDMDMNTLKSAGVSEGEIAEIVGHVAFNIMTNYFNNTALPEIDFPMIRAKNSAMA